MTAARVDVTVVIPTHDRQHLLVEAVESVLAQDGPRAEVLVVDDASTDGTPEWLARLDDRRVRSIRLDPGRERTAARNAGLAVVDSPYVLFLDDDDVLAPRALARLVVALERHPDAPVAAGTYATFGTYGPEELPRRQPNGFRVVQRQMWREILGGWYLLPGAGLWRTTRLRALGGWDESRTFAEDLELSLRIHPAPMALVPHVVLRYRQHGRPVDRDRQEWERKENDQVRRQFVDRLPPGERAAAERVLRARPVFAEALDAYAAGDYRGAARNLTAGMRMVPSLAVSPVLGPVLGTMLVKSIAAVGAPESMRRRVRTTRAAARARRYGSMPT